MVQVTISGRADSLSPIKEQLSQVVHQCLHEVLGTPMEKRFQRFLPLPAEDFIYPADRSRHYTLIEIMLFEGRSVALKKQLIQALYREISQSLSIAPADVEIILLEVPSHNWGVRGVTGDEL